METKFVDGLFYNLPSEKAPDTIIANMSINPPRFIAWLSEQKPNESGYVKIVVKKGQKGTIYAALNTWEPRKQEPQDNIPDDFFDKA